MRYGKGQHRMNRATSVFLALTALVVLSGCSSSGGGSPPEIIGTPAARLASATTTSSATSLVLSTATILEAGSSDAAAQVALGDATVRARLRSMALVASSGAGVSSPTTILAVAASDHQAAQTIISGATIADHAPVYVVEMTGGPFTANQYPPGGQAPQGDVLTLTIDAQTYQVRDVGFHPVAPDLTQIGSVMTL